MSQCIFDQYGCKILEQDGTLFVSYDSGESFGGRTIEHEISKGESEEIMLGEQQAYRVIMNARRRDGME